MEMALHKKKDGPSTDGRRANNSNIVLFCTEGGRNIGMGHVMRSLSIAHAMKIRGIKVLFIVNEDNAALDAVSSEGYPVKGLDFKDPDFIGYIKNCPFFRAVVFDTKRDITEEAGYFRRIGLKVILVDNSTRAAETADLNIIPSLLPPSAFGKGRHNSQAVTGIRYFPLHHAFLKARQSGARRPGSGLRVLVTMGGADPNHLTSRLVRALQGMSGVELKVVIGPSMEQDRELADVRNGIEFIYGADVNKMASLMCDSDIAFTAFGITLYELAFMGVPSVVIANYREDKEDMTAFAAQGAGITLGYFEDVKDIDIKNTVALFLQNSDMSEHMRRNGRTLIDGNGPERIVNAIEDICCINITGVHE